MRRLGWLLRGPRWRSFNLEYCRECRRRFARSEPGSWADIRDDEFPELCNCVQRRDGTRSHENCRACGPYCAPCAVIVEAGIQEARDAYRDW